MNARYWPVLRSRQLLLILLSLHLAGILYYLPPSETFGNPPIARTDYTTHFYQAATVNHFLREAGRPWGYDPHHLAGYPVGTVFDVNNKGLEVATWLLSSFVDVSLAFNLAVLILFAAFPLAIYFAGGLLGLAPWARSLAIGLALIVWYTDPTVHWAWAGGTFSFAAASGLAVVTLAAFIRYANTPTWHAFVALAVSAPVTVLASPQVAVALALPALIGYALSARRLSLRQHLSLVAIAGLVVAVNAFWLWPFLQFINIKVNATQFLQADVGTLIGDLLGTARVDGSPPCRCGLRWLMLGLTGHLWLSQPQKRGYVAILASGAISLFALAYLGSYWRPLANLQPYRFVIPASLMLILPAADGLIHLAADPPPLRWRTAAAGLAAVFLITQTAQGAWYYRPDLSHVGQPGQLDDGRLGGPPTAYRTVMDWINANTAPDGRLLINDWRLGALVPYYTDREVIGGPFLWVWIKYGYANAGIWDAFGRDLDSYTEAELRQTLHNYNIQWVITNIAFERDFYTLDDVARRWPRLLRPADEVAGFQIYRLPWSANSFLVGRGTVSAGYNRINVADASPSGVVLKYHWLPTLCSEPPLPLAPHPIPGAPVEFIHVDNGTTRNFVIYNAYSACEPAAATVDGEKK